MTAPPRAHHTLTMEIVEHKQADVQMSDQQARMLQVVAGPRLVVSPNTAGYSVRASSYVGSITIPGLVVHVVPKIPVDNVLHMLTWSAHRITFDHHEVTHTTRSLTPAVAAWYARMLERALALGIDRAYVEGSDRLVALRGRIDWPAQSTAAGLPTPISCRYDEWSIDTRANRIVAGAALALLRNPVVPAQSAFSLRRLLKLLQGVGPLRADDLTHPAPLFNRLNLHYESTVHLARLILEGAGHGHGGGAEPVSAFMVDMNVVFEDFVYASLHLRLRGVWTVARQQLVPLGDQGQVPGEPDLIFRDVSGNPVLVADCKYKLTSDGRGRSGDYYQLLAYCTALGLPRGVLIYCDAGDATPVPARSVHVRNTQTTLETARVQLSGSPETISRALDHLALQILGDQ